MKERLAYLVGHLEREIANLKTMSTVEDLEGCAVLESVIAIHNWTNDLIYWYVEENK